MLRRYKRPAARSQKRPVSTNHKHKYAIWPVGLAFLVVTLLWSCGPVKPSSTATITVRLPIDTTPTATLIPVLGQTPSAPDLPTRTATPTAAVSPVKADSYSPSISADGRYVAFTSEASNLVPDDTEQCPGPAGRQSCSDVFVFDRESGSMALVSRADDGRPGNGGSGGASISADGRWIAFSSAASNLVADDTNGVPDVFVYDRLLGTIERVSMSSTGVQGDRGSGRPSISGDGRYVVFSSPASDLVPGDAADTWDVFVHDRETGETERVSTARDGKAGDEDSYAPQISADGRWVAFWSWAGNLVADDTETCQWGSYTYSCGDVFLYDRSTGGMRRIAVNDPAHFRHSGLGGGSYSPPGLSGDGRWVAFAASIYDWQTGETHPLCNTGGPKICGGVLSADGQWVAFDNGADVFVYNRLTGKTELVSVASDGTRGNGKCCVIGVYEGTEFAGGVDLSADGRWVAFASTASNLVPGDTQECMDPIRGPYNCYDVFVHDRETGITEWISKTGNK